MLVIYLLGGLRLEVDGRPLRFTALPKTLPLWAHLLLNRNTATPRAALAYTIWPDVSEDEARGNLRRHLYELRRALPPTPQDCPWILADAFTVQWNPQASYWLDVQAFEELCADSAQLRQAVQLYAGDLLPELFEEWIYFGRERLRTLFFDALQQLIAAERAAGDYTAAINHASLLLQHDPLREDVVRTLMALRVQSGDGPGALLDYRRFAHRLRHELDVSPTVETSALYDSIARQLLTAAAPPLPVFSQPSPDSQPSPRSTAPPNNLPAQLTSFIGRETELAALRSLLSTNDGRIRLITLTGPGGSGKTRLSLELAARLLLDETPLFPDGVFLASLTATSDPQSISSAIVNTLGVKQAPQNSALETLRDWLHEKHILLLLDNFEHLIEGAPVVTDLLATAPGLSIMVTSRALLHVYGEREFIVTPLPVPKAEEFDDPETLTRYASVNLFLTRSRASKPTFVLNRENAAAIAELCVHLDGLPLALELAAARSKLFTPQAMLGRLREQLTFFADSRLPERQRTLRATLDWSYQLLSLEERHLFVRLAVFAGRFSLEAVEKVCAPNSDIDVLDTMTGLVDHSLVQQLESGGDETIYLQMLSIVRQYAAGLLSPEEETTLRLQHAAYYAQLTKRAYPEFSTAGQAKWSARLAAEDANLSAALAFSLRVDAAPAEIAFGAVIAQSLQRYWQIHGRLREGYEWYLRAINHAKDLAPEMYIYMHNLAGSFAAMQGDLMAARGHHEAALQSAHPLGNGKLEATTLHFLGLTIARSGDLAQSHRLLTECLKIYRRTPEITSADLSSLLNNLAVVSTRLGDYAQSIVLLSEGLELCRARGDKLSMGHVLSSLGDLALRQGDLVASARYHQESLLVRQELNNRLGMLASVEHVASLAVAQKRFSEAARLYAAAEALQAEYHTQLTGHQLDEHRENVARLRSMVEPNDLERSWRMGAGMSLDEAVRLASAVTSS